MVHTEEGHLKVHRIGQVLLINVSLVVDLYQATLLFASSWAVLIQAPLKSLMLETRCFMCHVLPKPEQPEKGHMRYTCSYGDPAVQCWQ